MRLRDVLVRPIKWYQKYISPLKSPSCRFTPTCSNYAIEAIERFGIFKGSILAIWRVLRCNPYSKGGEDPVPTKFVIGGKHR